MTYHLQQMAGGLQCDRNVFTDSQLPSKFQHLGGHQYEKIGLICSLSLISAQQSVNFVTIAQGSASLDLSEAERCL